MYKLVQKKIRTIWGNEVKLLHRLHTTDSMTANAVMVYDEYKAKDFSYKNGSIFVDIGSHIGTWGLLMATKNPTFKVYCFEALPENVEVIKKIIEVNNLENMFVFNLAILDTTGGSIKIYYTDDKTNFGRAHRFIGSSGGGPNHVEVETLDLNDILDFIGEDNIRVMKIDCEGCELKGFASITPDNLEKIDIVVGEFHPNSGITSIDFFNLFNESFENISAFNSTKPSHEMENFTFKRKGSY